MEKNEHVFPKARTTEVVTRDMPDEVLVYDLKTHKAHCLNQTAAAVWKYCDGKTSVMEIAALLKRDLSQTVDEAAVWLAVERLSRAQLLEEPIASPAGSPRLGRREAMRRLGLSSAIAVPLVMSIVAPTALAACTGGADPGVACSGTPVNGSPGIVDCTVCKSACCAAPTASAPSIFGTCVVGPSGGLANNSVCTRDCQCAPGNCSPAPGGNPSPTGRRC